MNGQRFPFDRDFQIGILSLMATRYDFLLTTVELLQPEYFEDKILAWFYQTMRDYYLTFQESPVLEPVVSNEIKKATRAGRIKASELGDYASVFREMKQPVNAQQYVISEVVRFCKRQEARKFMVEIAPQMDSADAAAWDDWLNRFQVISAFGSNHLDIGINYFGSAPERIRRRAAGDQRRIIPTGITELDIKMNGGLKDGQLGIWLGGTGTGKSVVLPSCGKRAIVQGFRVAHYTLELSEEDVADRYDSSWTRVDSHELNFHRHKVQSHLRYLETNLRYGDHLMIKGYPTNTATINTIHAHLKQLAATQWFPDLVIVDYGDLLKPLTHYDNEYSDLGAIFKDLRGLAGTYKVPCWTATQVNRSGMNQEIVDIEHMGDSIKKAQIADAIIGICTTREERLNNIIRLFGAKNRNGPSQFIIPIKYDFARMCFYDRAETDKMNEMNAQYAGQQGGAPPPTTPVKSSKRTPKAKV